MQTPALMMALLVWTAILHDAHDTRLFGLYFYDLF